MAKHLLLFAAMVPMALGYGCVSAGNDVDQTMQSTKLTGLVGQWQGDNKLWFMPGDPVRESKATAAVVCSEGGNVVVINYTWSYEGKPQEGTLVVRANSAAEDVEVVLVDTWHTAGKFMMFQKDDAHDGLVAVRGSYAAPPGPDWGWRIVVASDSVDEFHMLMFNITPDGEEAPAVEARFRRTD